MYRLRHPYIVLFLLGVASLLMYGSFAYDLERFDFIKLLSLYGGLFALAYGIIKQFGSRPRVILGLGLLFRFVFLLAVPNLSQDFYRFIWDGWVVLKGSNPFLFTPENYLSASTSIGIEIPNAQKLYEGMGALNGSHFSNYPPVKQWLFAVAAFFGGESIMGSIVALRVLLMTADIGVFIMGRKLLGLIQRNPASMAWYFLNPFIIIELTGNLHFEGVMVFFLITSLYFLLKKQWVWSAVFMGLSISLKLIPLLFLPIIIPYLWHAEGKPIQKIGRYFGATSLVILINFLPFINRKVILQFYDTTALWFQNFEFNASVYYIIRYIGFQIKGWNIIEDAGRWLAIIIFIFVWIIALFRKNRLFNTLLGSFLFAISLYYALSTTIHPWYIVLPLILGILSGYRFPLLWSFLVFLSYSAYGPNAVSENMLLIAVEYGILLLFMLWEFGYLFPTKKIPFQYP